MKIILINPPRFKDTECIAPSYMFDYGFNYPPLGLLYLASNLKGNHECKIIDALALKYSPYDCLNEIKEYKPLIVGMTVFTDSLYSCQFLSRLIKDYDRNIKIIWGGPHVNIYPRESIELPAIDYVLTGFSENSFSYLVNALDNEHSDMPRVFENIPGLWWANNKNIFISKSNIDKDWNINALKRPNRKLLDLDKYFTAANNKKITTIVSSRGCPFVCTFCDVFEKRFLERDASDIIDELKDIIDLGISEVNFFDDCFNLKRERVMQLCQLIIDNKLKFEWSFRGRIEPCDEELTRLLYNSGCRRVQLGVEGSDQETINRINKKINIEKLPKILKTYRQSGIKTMGYFIIGFPFQRYEDCVVSCKKIINMGFDYINMFILIPYPNTSIYKELLTQGIIKRDQWHEYAVNPRPYFKLERWHPYIEREVLEVLMDKYYGKFYLSPRRIFSEFKGIRSLNSLIHKSKMAMGIIKGCLHNKTRNSTSVGS